MANGKLKKMLMIYNHTIYFWPVVKSRKSCNARCWWGYGGIGSLTLLVWMQIENANQENLEWFLIIQKSWWCAQITCPRALTLEMPLHMSTWVSASKGSYGIVATSLAMQGTQTYFSHILDTCIAVYLAVECVAMQWMKHSYTNNRDESPKIVLSERSKT